MKIYEFITPSDPITFKAENDKIAFTCSLLLGSGKAGTTRHDENGGEISIPSLLIFNPDHEQVIKDFLGCELDEFIHLNKEQVRAALKSFAYGNIESRKTFDDALNAITEENKRKEFLEKHEDRNRSSLSAWVKAGWKLADNLK